jgi:hypothetical protein
MLDFISPSNFDFFARYFLAGFIIFSVRSRYVLGEKPKATEVVFESVVLSLLNQLAFIVIAPSVGYASSLLPDRLVHVIEAIFGGRTSFFIEILVLPALLGVIFGANLRRGWNSAILRRLAMPIVHPTRRAYDFAFGDNRSESFVIVTYADGTLVYGYFGPNSLAASDGERSDLYLERLYDVQDDGTWVATSPPKSALLMLREFRSVEFIQAQTEARNERKAT